MKNFCLNQKAKKSNRTKYSIFYDFNNTKLEGITENYSIYEKSGVKIGVFGLGIELKGLVNPDLYKETKYLHPKTPYHSKT